MNYSSKHTMYEKVALAKKMSKEPTIAEKALYSALSEAHIKYFKQYICCGYILDAYLPDFKIGLECDGGYHGVTSQQFYDIERDSVISKQGITVIRFNNEDVLRNPMAIISNLRKNYKIPRVRKRPQKKQRITMDKRGKLVKDWANNNAELLDRMSKEPGLFRSMSKNVL